MWIIVGIVLLLSSFKNLPLVWHGRLIYTIIFHGRLSKRRGSTIEQEGCPAIFRPVVTTTRSPLSECDINGHKSDSTYFSDLDINRIHLISTLSRGAAGHSARSTRSGDALLPSLEKMRILLGGTSCMFRREIKPYQLYEIHSRVLAWDEKWIYISSHFVEKRALRKLSQGQHLNGKYDLARAVVFASAITKYVFKEGSTTITPADALSALGFLPRGQSVSNGDVGENTTNDKVEADTGIASWTYEKIDQERRKGMETAKHFIALDAMHGQFGDTAARHHN